MSKRAAAPLSYAASLSVEPPAATKPAMSQQPVATDDGWPGQGRGRRPLEEAADPSVLYLHPTGKKALRLYAVERGVKVHDLLLEAVETWADSKGLAGPWRVPSAGPPRRRRG
jgi:hypothetical protein